MCATLRSRSQARAREQPATEAAIIIAVGHACGTILRACFCHQVANLARGCGERTLMVVRLVARHGGDQEFEIVGHAVLHGLGKCRDRGRSRRECILI